MEALQKPWLCKDKPPILLQNVNIIDVAAAKVLTGYDMVLQHGLFAEIVPHDNLASRTDAVEIHDYSSRYVCPGLIDAHVHLIAPPGEKDLGGTFNMANDVMLLRQPFYAKDIIKRGFTTVRDCGGATLPLKQAFNEGTFVAPRVFIAGHALSQTGGHGDLRGATDHTDLCASHGIRGLGRVCDGVAECSKAARDELRCGSDFLKIMTGGGVSSPTDALENVQFEAEEIRAITAAAKKVGKMVTAHAYTPQSVRHAIENGCDGIEHGNLLDPDTVKLMVQKGTWLTPTLITYEALASPEFKGFLPEALREKNDTVRADGLMALKMATEAGVKICYGTDLLGPLTSWQSKEFEIRSQIQAPSVVLQSATVNPAKMLGQQHRLGQVKEGFIADLLILDANPLDDIRILSEPTKHILAVIKDGEIVHQKAP